MENKQIDISKLSHRWKQPLSVISLAATSLQIQKEMGILNDEFFYDATNKILSNIDKLSEDIKKIKENSK